jgi:hypothetical protein
MRFSLKLIWPLFVVRIKAVPKTTSFVVNTRKKFQEFLIFLIDIIGLDNIIDNKLYAYGEDGKRVLPCSFLGFCLVPFRVFSPKEKEKVLRRKRSR